MQNPTVYTVWVDIIELTAMLYTTVCTIGQAMILRFY